MKLEQRIDRNIMVKSPYNILYDLVKTSDVSVSCKVKNEFSLANEDGPISASEAGRHLAILGSIALSLTRDVPHYYLAVEAEITRSSLNSEPSHTLYLEANISNQNERKGYTYGRLYNDAKTLIYEIKVTYKILSVPLFSKLFKTFHSPMDFKPSQQSYAVRKQLSNITIDNANILADYGTVLSEDCNGHFENYPALPVAIICGAFTELGLALFFNNPDNKYEKAIATHARISASRLVFADEALSFKGVIQETTPQSITVYFEGIVAHKKVADATFKIEGV